MAGILCGGVVRLSDFFRSQTANLKVGGSMSLPSPLPIWISTAVHITVTSKVSSSHTMPIWGRRLKFP